MQTLASRLAGYLLGDGYRYRAVYRKGDKGQCIHLAPKVEGRAPTLCGIDRANNGGGVQRFGRRKFFSAGAWMRLSAVNFQGRDVLVSGGLLGWQPQDRHLCRACLHALPKKKQ